MDPSCTDGHFESSVIQNIISPPLFRLFILHCLRVMLYIRQEIRFQHLFKNCYVLA